MSTRWSPLPALPVWGDNGRQAVASALVGGATVALVGRLLGALLLNVPGQFGSVPMGALTGAGATLASLALLALALDTGRPAAGVGLLFAGVFGLLSVAGAVLPAAVALVGGLLVYVWRSREQLSPVAGFVTGLLLVAMTSALAAGLGGLIPLRGLASTVTFLALGTTPAFTATDRRSLLPACLAFAAVVAVGLALPFVTGAVTLVATGAVGTSLPVVGVAVAGVVTAGSAATRERRWLLLAGVALLASAGVPATLDRAVPFALGIVTLVTGEVRR